MTWRFYWRPSRFRTLYRNTNWQETAAAAANVQRITAGAEMSRDRQVPVVNCRGVAWFVNCAIAFAWQPTDITRQSVRAGHYQTTLRVIVCPVRQSAIITCVINQKQESRTVARKPRDAAAVLFGLKFADSIHYKFISSQASKARLQSPKHTGAKQNLTQSGHSRVLESMERRSWAK